VNKGYIMRPVVKGANNLGIDPELGFNILFLFWLTVKRDGRILYIFMSQILEFGSNVKPENTHQVKGF